jgi:putative radical SAM enzyme (TIGR03279 family)
MAFPQVVAVAPGSPAALAGLVVGDEISSLNGVAPRDVIEYRVLTDEADLDITARRGGLEFEVVVHKHAGEPLGVEVSSALFDRVRTCDNHCAFCFIYQLPKKMRKSLYVKDDDYRLSFLYGNFTTLTRFTELDLARVVDEGLSPLYVSIHATDPGLRADMVRNRRGATSLRWLRALLDHGVVVHGQIVVCPGVNDGVALANTLGGILERFPELATVAAVPLGVSRYSTEATMRAHSPAEAAAVLDTVAIYQEVFRAALGRTMVYAADEYYLLAGRPFPDADTYEGFPQHENGIGMARLFAESFAGHDHGFDGARGGFFASVDGAPAAGYRAPRTASAPPDAEVDSRPVTILTGTYGAMVLAPLVAELGRPDIEVLAVRNDFFGGNIAVTGLLTGTDLAATLATRPYDRRYLLPDVCLSEDRFLDGMTLADLPRAVEVVETTGAALGRALNGSRRVVRSEALMVEAR